MKWSSRAYSAPDDKITSSDSIDDVDVNFWDSLFFMAKRFAIHIQEWRVKSKDVQGDPVILHGREGCVSKHAF